MVYTFPLVTGTLLAFTPDNDVTHPTRILSLAGGAAWTIEQKQNTTIDITTIAKNNCFFIP